MVTIHNPGVFVFGLLGNVISFMVFLAPLPTFIRVYKKKTTEGFKSLPYVVAVLSAMLWIYYALLKGNAVLLITINVAGFVIETIYVAVYVIYAPRKAKISTLKLFLLMNIGGFCAIVLVCHYLVKGATRVQVFGWVCVAMSISVFAAPLSVIRLVIRTKSVEYMPFNLSLCLTLTAAIWFMYGLFLKDLYIALPNIVGFVLGVAQMALYGIYRKYDKKAAEKQKLPEQVPVASPLKQITAESHPINSLPKNNHEDVISPSQPPQIEIEVVINENKESSEENFHGPPQGPSTCNVDAEKIVGGPGPTSVQLVQCAV